MIKKITDSIKTIIGEKHEVTEAIREALEERVVSPFYGYFIISWILINWNYIYAALFTSSESILEKKDLLRNEYLFQQILPSHLSSFTYWLDFFVLPFIFTCLAFWLMPFVTRIFLRQHIRNKVINEGIRAEELAAEIKAEEKVLEAEVSKAKVEREAQETNPRILWRQEFDSFKNHKLFNKFSEIIDHYYQYRGSISYRSADFAEHEISQDILVYCDANELITIDGNDFEITPKGREFVRLYSNDNSNNTAVWN